MTARWITADVFDGLATLEDGSVDLVVTSPPFLALRSYLPADHPDKGKEIGSEPTPAEFIDVMLRVTAELRRVLAPHGSICVELGDTYAGPQPPFRFTEAHSPDQPLKTGEFINAKMGESNISGRIGEGWPLAKSRTLIPQLYEIALAYGINPLTGQPSPAGQWRIRNVVTWARPNPPVGALGDKWRPATSDLIVACVSGKRYWDDLATRRPAWGDSVGWPSLKVRKDSSYQRKPSEFTKQEEERPGSHPSGAPLLDYWEIPLLEGEEPKQYGPGEPKPYDRPNLKGKGSRATLVPGQRKNQSDHATNDAGAPLLDYWEIPPGGYKGSHYAVFPDELVVPCVKAMCPERVCRTCGEPSRRLLTKQATWDRQPELAAHIRERREALGVTSAEINGWFGYKEIAKNWERTDSFGNRVPSPADWVILKERLGLSDDFDSFIMERRESLAEYEAHGVGKRQNSEAWAQGAQGQYGGAQSMPLGRATKISKDGGWTDCGHDDWRPGLVLDPFAGSGTTLSVATGHGHDAIGFDLDSRNAVLAWERIGPFMFEEVHV